MKIKSFSISNSSIPLLIAGLLFSSLAGFIFMHLQIEYFIAILFITTFLALIYFRIDWGIGLLIASMLFEKTILSTNLSFTKILTPPVLFIALLKIMSEKKGLYFQILKDGTILMLFFWMMLSIIYAINPLAVRSGLLTYLQLAILYFVLKSVIISTKEIGRAHV